MAPNEAHDASDTQNYGVPQYVIKNRDGRMLGLSPIPDQEYNIYFFAYDQMPKVTDHSDTFEFQEQYVPVLKSRVRYYAWQFKENPQQAALALQDWTTGIRRMREQLLEEQPAREFSDNRTRWV